MRAASIRRCKVLQVSARTGEGMQAWIDWLIGGARHGAWPAASAAVAE